MLTQGAMAELVAGGLLLGAIYVAVSVGLSLIFGVMRVKLWCTNRLMDVGRQLSPPFRRYAAIPACRAGSSG